MRFMTFVAAAAAGLLTMAVPVKAEVIYDSISNPLPPNQVSEGYQCCQNGNFGDEIQFSAGSRRNIGDVNLTLSDWAKQSDYSSLIGQTGPDGTTYSSSGFTVPLTLNLYTVDNSGANPVIGSLIASRTINPTILWRPADDLVNCPGDSAWSSGGVCYHGLDQNVTFDFAGTTVPDAIIYSLAFNTQSYGVTPTGIAGPYTSLNFALNTTGPSVGTNVELDAVFRNGARETGWSPYTPAAQFNAPEPASMMLVGVGLAGLGMVRRRRR